MSFYFTNLRGFFKLTRCQTNLKTKQCSFFFYKQFLKFFFCFSTHLSWLHDNLLHAQEHAYGPAICEKPNEELPAPNPLALLPFHTIRGRVERKRHIVPEPLFLYPFLLPKVSW